MSYRCDICDAVVPHGHSQLKHVVYQTDAHGRLKRPKNIEREVPVCGECDGDLRFGVSLSIMYEEHAAGRRKLTAPDASILLKSRPAVNITPVPLAPVKILGQVVHRAALPSVAERKEPVAEAAKPVRKLPAPIPLVPGKKPTQPKAAEAPAPKVPANKHKPAAKTKPKSPPKK